MQTLDLAMASTTIYQQETMRSIDKDLDVLYESPATLNDSWGFKYYDNNWKVQRKCLKQKNILKGLV